VAAIFTAGAVACAGCGSLQGSAVSSASSDLPGQAGISASASYGSPVQATLWWFSAINDKDKAAAAAGFEPAAAG